MREKRRKLTAVERYKAGASICHILSRKSCFLSAKSIAVYFSQDGEIPLDMLVSRIWQSAKRCYLPILTGCGKPQMRFAPYLERSKLVENRFNIPEPVVPRKKRVNSQNLDLVLVPLVGFDSNGNRLGMGGGYYDRSFAFLRRRKVWKKPFLLGIAYDFQELKKINKDSWDIPLSGIVTPSRFIKI